jgi:hypothetical protein
VDYGRHLKREEEVMNGLWTVRQPRQKESLTMATTNGRYVMWMGRKVPEFVAARQASGEADQGI